MLLLLLVLHCYAGQEQHGGTAACTMHQNREHREQRALLCACAGSLAISYYYLLLHCLQCSKFRIFYL